jgi:hypothetical protein
MNRSKAIASSLIALLLLCVVAENAEAGRRNRCRHNRRAKQCCTQTCHHHTPTCGCEGSGYESSSSQYDSQSPDAAPSQDTYDGSDQNSEQTGRSSDEAPSPDSDAGNSNIPPAPPEAPAAPSATN